MYFPFENSDKKVRYTYKDYLSWPEDERWELIEGIPYNLAPAPSRRHQEILGSIFNILFSYLKDKACKVYMAPFDVRLPEGKERDEDIKNVVQPDIVIVCDKEKLDDRGCKGSPDLIVEIVSPNTASKDYIEKLALYERNKVKEYWIVHPIDNIVMVYKLNESGQYGRPEIYSSEAQVKVGIFPDLTINLKEVFAE